MTDIERDRLSSIAFINLYTLGKDTHEIAFINFNIHDRRHLACIHIAKLAWQILNYNFYMSSNILDYWKLNWKCRSKKWLKRVKSTANYKTVDVEDFISHIEEANNQSGGFAEIYDAYYKVYDR